MLTKRKKVAKRGPEDFIKQRLKDVLAVLCYIHPHRLTIDKKRLEDVLAFELKPECSERTARNRLSGDRLQGAFGFKTRKEAADFLKCFEASYVLKLDRCGKWKKRPSEAIRSDVALVCHALSALGRKRTEAPAPTQCARLALLTGIDPSAIWPQLRDAGQFVGELLEVAVWLGEWERAGARLKPEHRVQFDKLSGLKGGDRLNPIESEMRSAIDNHANMMVLGGELGTARRLLGFPFKAVLPFFAFAAGGVELARTRAFLKLSYAERGEADLVRVMEILERIAELLGTQRRVSDADARVLRKARTVMRNMDRKPKLREELAFLADWKIRNAGQEERLPNPLEAANLILEHRDTAGR